MRGGKRDSSSSSSSSSSDSEDEDMAREEPKEQETVSDAAAALTSEEPKQKTCEEPFSSEESQANESFAKSEKDNLLASSGKTLLATDGQLDNDDQDSNWNQGSPLMSESKNKESGFVAAAIKDSDLPGKQSIDNRSSSFDPKDSSIYEHEEPTRASGGISVIPSKFHSNTETHHSSSDSESSLDVKQDENNHTLVDPGLQHPDCLTQHKKPSISPPSSSEDEKSAQKQINDAEEYQDKFPSAKDPNKKLPIVLDSSDSFDEGPIQERLAVDIHSQKDDDVYKPIPDKKSYANTLHKEGSIALKDYQEPISRGSSSSSSSSSSNESEEDDAGPLVIKQTQETSNDKELTPLSLRRALEERERELELRREQQEYAAELGARKPSEPASVVESTTMDSDYMGRYSPDAFDFDGYPSLRARTAFDFEDPALKVSPALPSKQSDIKTISAPDIDVQRKTYSDVLPDVNKETSRTVDVHANIFHIDGKSIPLGRRKWLEDDDEGEASWKPIRISHHPPADRVIDFSKSPDGDHSEKRSRSRDKSGRSRSNSRKRSKENKYDTSCSPSSHRVVHLSGKPYDSHQSRINSQVLVSLRDNAFDTDAYDTVQETGDELNKLIEKANSLSYHHDYPNPAEDVFPKTKLRQMKLESKHPNAFAKIVAPIPVHPQQTQLSDRHISDNWRKSNRSLPRKRQKAPPSIEAVDGDDETSLAESEVDKFVSQRILAPEPSIPFVTELYPSDYTEFETVSEVDTVGPNDVKRDSSFMSDDSIREVFNPALQTAGESAYDTVLEVETDVEVSPKVELNAIVSSKFQICSNISGSKSFPARLREGKPKKTRPGMGHLAIPLNQASKNRNQYPTSLPYFCNDFANEESDFDRMPRRAGSVDDLPGIPILNPSIVVHRQPTHPKGCRPEIVQEIHVRKAPSLPEKKAKKKKKREKKVKKDTDDKPVPQINLKVDGESSNLNNNLQINLLPSDDPNVINLNIRSTSVNPPEPTSIPVITTQPQSYQPTQPACEHQLPVSAMVHSQSSVSPADNQHRVVEISAPPMVITGNDFFPQQAPYSSNGGIMIAGSAPIEILPNPILAAAASQQFTTSPAQQSQPNYPTLSLGPAQTVPLAVLPSTQSLPAAPPPLPPVINTHETMPPVQQQRLQPNSETTVVDIHNPRILPEERDSSFPAKKFNRMNRGDSGIDLTMHERSRRPRSRTPKAKRRRSKSRSTRNRDLSSSSDRSSHHGRRPSSQRKLKPNDYLRSIGPSNEYMEWYKDKYLKPSCCYLFMKHVMFAINLIFTLAGLALVGLGIWGMVVLHQNGVSGPGVIFLDPLFAVMVVGFVTTLVAFHGAAGFIRDNICMLKCFGSLLVMLFITFIVGGIVIWVKISSVEEFTISTYGRLIRQYNPESRVGLSYSIDLMQNTFECCGIADPGSSYWAKNKLFKCRGAKCPLPASCCRNTQDRNFDCLSSSELKHPQSCIDTMSTAVKNQTPAIVGIWIGIWALMMIELICIYNMCKEINYIQKIRDFLIDPVKHMKSRREQCSKSDSTESGSSKTDSSDTEAASSEDEYRKKKQTKRARQKQKDSKKSRKGGLGKCSSGIRGRRGLYHVNQGFSIEDEKRSSHSRGSHRGSSKSRSKAWKLLDE